MFYCEKGIVAFGIIYIAVVVAGFTLNLVLNLRKINKCKKNNEKYIQFEDYKRTLFHSEYEKTKTERLAFQETLKSKINDFNNIIQNCSGLPDAYKEYAPELHGIFQDGTITYYYTAFKIIVTENEQREQKEKWMCLGERLINSIEFATQEKLNEDRRHNMQIEQEAKKQT